MKNKIKYIILFLISVVLIFIAINKEKTATLIYLCLGIVSFIVALITAIKDKTKNNQKQIPIINNNVAYPVQVNSSVITELYDYNNDIIYKNINFPNYNFFIRNNLYEGLYYFKSIQFFGNGTSRILNFSIILFIKHYELRIFTAEQFNNYLLSVNRNKSNNNLNTTIRETESMYSFVPPETERQSFTKPLPITQRFPKDSNLQSEILPYKKKPIINENEDDIFKAITKISFKHKKYLFLQVRLLDIVDINETLYKNSIREAWINYLASKTVDYIFYDIQKRNISGALLCTKNASESDKAIFDILNACGIKTVIMNEDKIIDLLPKILDNFEIIQSTYRNNYTFDKDKLYPKDFNFEIDELPLYKKDIFTNNEFRFFQKIAKYAFDNRQYLTVKLRLSNFISTSGIKDQFLRTSWFNVINRKHTDFLLYDIESRLPTACIEIDDNTHSQNVVVQRDKIKDNILKSSNIPMVRLKEPSEIFTNQKLKDVLNV